MSENEYVDIETKENPENSSEFIEEETKLENLKLNRSLLRSKNTRRVTEISDLVASEIEIENLKQWRISMQASEKALTAIEDKIKNLSENLQKPYNEKDIEKHNKYVEQTISLLNLIEIRINNVASMDDKTNADATAFNSKFVTQEDFYKTFANLFEKLGDKIGNMQEKSPLHPVKVPLPEFNPDISGSSFKDFKFQLELYFQQHENIAENMKPFYLRQQLKGKAASMVNCIPSSETYASLIDLLERAFSHKNKEKYDVIKSLISLEYKADHSYFASLSAILNIMNLNNMTIEDLQRYFAWNCLPIVIRNNIKSLTGNQDPTLFEIKENIFDAQRLANENYEARQIKNKSMPIENKLKESRSNRAIAAALNVQGHANSSNANSKQNAQTPSQQKKGASANKELKNKSENNNAISNAQNNANAKTPFCSLCHKDNNNFKHWFNECEVYSDYDARLKRIRQLNG